MVQEKTHTVRCGDGYAKRETFIDSRNERHKARPRQKMNSDEDILRMDRDTWTDRETDI